MFNIALFNKHLSTLWLGRSLLFFDELQSTNSYLKHLPFENLEHGVVVLADSQSAGRGQHRRVWVSEPGANLTFSFGLKNQRPEGISVLSLAAALAVADFLKGETRAPVHIKWPNDILLSGKKIAGILTETSFCGNAPERIVIGIGFNINQKEFPEELSKPATSLFLELGTSRSREVILCELLQRIEYQIGRWQQHQKALISDINKNMLYFGEQVTVEINDSFLHKAGKFLGINASGSLLLLNNDMEVDTFSHEQINLFPYREQP